MNSNGLQNVQALVFDVFGTTVDWHGSLVEELAALGKKLGYVTDSHRWSDFAKTWRRGYIDHIHEIAQGGTGTLNTDEMHRGILEKILRSPEWTEFGTLLDTEERDRINNAWHRLHGWLDATEGLYALKKHTMVAALSNGNLRLLIDMAKHSDLPWDVVLSSELFGSFKPDTKVYADAMKHLALAPEHCAMVATHVWDLGGAARAGMKTIYVRRAAQEPVPDEELKLRSDGGEVDLVIDSFTELAGLFAARK